MKFKLRIPIIHQGRSAKHKATIGERYNRLTGKLEADQVIELETSTPCKSELARRGYYQGKVEANLMALVLPDDRRPIACLSYLPSCIVETTT